MLMHEAPHAKGPRDTDPVAAALAAIRSSSLQRARYRVQVAHPVVGRVIAQLLATGDEQGFLDGWAVAEALDNLAALPVESTLAPRILHRIFEVSEASDSTIFVALVRSGNRAAPVSWADKTSKRSAPTAPRNPRPSSKPPSPLIQSNLSRPLVVLLSVLCMWIIGATICCAALLHNRCLQPEAPPLPEVTVAHSIELNCQSGINVRQSA
jgi:hypothetical protein